METMIRPFKRMRFEEPGNSKKRRYECLGNETNEIISNKCPRISSPVFFVNLFPPKKAEKRKFQVDIIENVKKSRFCKIKNVAAIKIQKVYRGWCCRYRLKKTAAIKIQRIYRGWLIRRKFHLRKFHFYN